jgi:AmmeMemoRadiSam system protein B
MSIRRAAVAGTFYSAANQELRRSIETYIKDSGITASPAMVTAVVAPHAGHVYSGATAGFIFARVQGKRPERVVLLGRSHHYGFDGAAVSSSTAFETPLGMLQVDMAFASRLKEEARRLDLDVDEGGGRKSHGSFSEAIHEKEHALEVLLPFIQVALGEVSIVPVLFGADAKEPHVRFGEKLAELLAPDDLVVASTDLSHFLSEDEANAIDGVTLDTVVTKDCYAVIDGLSQGTCAMCGGTAVVTAMAYANTRDADDWTVMDHRTSAAVTGDDQRVVGYGAVSMERQFA